MVENSERIDRFLRKKMTNEENQKFLDDLRSDEELRKEAQLTALMIQELKQRQAIEDAEIINDVLATKKRAKIIQIVKWSLSVAAIFIMIFVGVRQWNETNAFYTKTDALFAQYYSAFDTSTIRRGGNDEVKLKELADLYNKVGTDKDITPVIARLQTIYDNILSQNEDYADYRNEKNDIAWYLALAYVKSHNLEKAKDLLKPLIENGDVEAEELLNKIVELK